MNVLALMPGRCRVEYALFSGAQRQPAAAGAIPDYDGDAEGSATLAEFARGGGRPDVVGVRLIHGGERFRESQRVDAATLRGLDALASRAPLHAPLARRLLDDCRAAFPAAEVVAVFETAFFADLPARERVYALDPACRDQLGAQRYGFHGLLHAAACDAVRAARRRRGTQADRLVSLCLEPRPEAAAVLGRRPVMVTGGATPLEGLPGLTTCGEIDPALVLTLGDRLGWGPEQVDRLLSRESGLLGLAGRPVTLDEVFFQDQPDLRLAREVMTYRILLACGAAVAALGGLDALVFSGRFARAGEVLGPVLVERLLPRRPEQSRGISTEFFHESLARVVADEAIRAAAGALTRA